MDENHIINAMQSAVDIVNTSEHAYNKISACLFDPLIGDIVSKQVNYRPDHLKNKFDVDVKIGQSSQFIHAETACLFDSDQPTNGLAIAVTDPFCPNCAKAMIEAGIRHIYIDHKGLDKDFAKRREEEFESLSLLMAEKAGTFVGIVYRKERRIESLIHPQVETRAMPSGIEFFDWGDRDALPDVLKKFRDRQPHGAWAIAQIQEQDGTHKGVFVQESLTNGMTPQDFVAKSKPQAKYRFPVDPLNRLYYFAKRKGFHIVDNHVGVNLHPSSRALVNSVGMGIKTVSVGEQTPDHDPMGLDAAAMLEEAGFITVVV